MIDYSSGSLLNTEIDMIDSIVFPKIRLSPRSLTTAHRHRLSGILSSSAGRFAPMGDFDSSYLLSQPHRDWELAVSIGKCVEPFKAGALFTRVIQQSGALSDLFDL